MVQREFVRRLPTPRASAYVAAALAAAIFTAAALFRITFPFEPYSYEANAWAPAMLLTGLHSPYTQTIATSPPYVASAYGPVYYLLVGIGLRLFGYQFWFGRLLCWACAAVLPVLIYRIGGRFHSGRTARVLAGGLLLAELPLVYWAGVQRPDTIAIFFVMLGLTFVLRPRTMAAKPVWDVLAALALLAAVLTRQTDFLPILVACAWYIYTGRRANLLRFILTLAAAATASIVVLSIWSSGGFFASLVTNQAHATESLATLIRLVRDCARAPATWLTLAGVLLALPLSLDRPDGGNPAVNIKPLRSSDENALTLILLAYVLLSVVIACVTAARAGADLNYFIEPAVAGCLLISVGGSLIAQRLPARAWLAVAALVALSAVDTGGRAVHGGTLLGQTKPYLTALVAYLHRVPASAGPMFSEHPDLIYDARRTSWVNDFAQYDGRSPRLRTAFDKLLASKKLSVIVWPGREIWTIPAPRGYVRVTLAVPEPRSLDDLLLLYVRADLAQKISTTGNASGAS